MILTYLDSKSDYSLSDIDVFCAKKKMCPVLYLRNKTNYTRLVTLYVYSKLLLSMS